MKFSFYLILFICLSSLTILIASAETVPLNPLWECKLKNKSNKQSYNCSRDKFNRRSAVTGLAKPAKSNQLEIDLQVLSKPMENSVIIQPAQQINSDGLVWTEKVLKLKDLPVPTLFFYTVKNKTAYQYTVIADERDFEDIKKEIKNAVSAAK